jgi:hypothetical protein
MNKKIMLLTLVICLSVIGTSYVGNVSALTDSDAQTYAPILYFVNDEKCYPVDVSYAFETCDLYAVGGSAPLLTAPINASQLSNYPADGYYLDNKYGGVDVGDNGIENDYQSKKAALGYKVYAHIEGEVIQYWFFYAFNGGDLNRHEGDWEMVQVVISGNQPTEVMFSQHYAGQKATWSQVEKEGTHVKVYVAKGSHANYIKPYSGKLGLASDTVADNGEILRPTDYTIEVLDTQPWLSFAGRWGWVGSDQSGAAESAILGEAGPNGPMFRENSQMWAPLTWAGSLQSADNNMFILEWFVYNFVMLFIIITLLSLGLLGFFIYRRHKKHGLGPRIFSLLYIDGMNAKSIGNILCIVALIVAILGLFYPWYTVSANVSIPGSTQTGTFQAISIDGLNGIQIRLPDKTGPIPMGTFALPFYVLLGVALVFLILSTIGVPESKKLGKKYINRGIRLLVPFILIMIFIIAVGSILPTVAPANLKGNTDVFRAANAISAAPMGGQYNVMIADTNGGTVALSWGFGLGVYLLLFAGILLIVAGILEMIAHATFFEQRNPKPSKKDKHKKQPEQPVEEKK